MKLDNSSVRRLCGAALIAVLALAAGGCDFTSKYVRFPVQEGSARVYYEKPFYDAFGIDVNTGLAYDAIERNDVDTALRYCEKAVRDDPNDQWAQWDLAIIYEIKGNWDGAEVAMKEAIRLDLARKAASKDLKKEVDGSYAAELEFIRRHKPMRPLMRPLR
jgi:Tfp pilus assembly protein PilF